MKDRLRYGHGFWASFMIAILLNGCAGTSPSVTFYTLNALSEATPDSQQDREEKECTIGIGPVTFPGYLDRPQIVTRSGQNRLDISEFHRWGDSLINDFSRTVAKNISLLLSTQRVTVYPWSDDFTPDYQITLDVEQFEGRLDRSVFLNVRWSIARTESKETVKRSAIEEPVSTAGHEGLVASMSRAVSKLSRDIAKEIN
jgi:uncharacterized lipoprotein YmbA